MKNIFLFFTIIFFFTQCNVPKYVVQQETKSFASRHEGRLEEGSTLLSAGYRHSFETTKDGKVIAKYYYANTMVLTDFETYTDSKLTTRDGLTIGWSDDGIKIKEGQYRNNKKVGEWKWYNRSNGNLSQVGKYLNGEETGQWLSYADDGTTLSSEYNYVNGKKEGEFKIWDKEGKLKKMGTYKDDEIETTEKGESTEEPEEFKIVEEMPRFPGCEDISDKGERKSCAERKMLMHIYSNIKYPSFARENGIQGMAIMRFVVEKDGSISELQSIKGICDEIRDECMRVINTLPKWIPGKQDGKPVRVQFHLPVRFKLE